MTVMADATASNARPLSSETPKDFFSAEGSLRLDILKGIMLVLLMTGHIKIYFPKIISILDLAWRPFGFFSMADGFVIASGITTGLSLVRFDTARKMWGKIVPRLVRIYSYHLMLTVVAVVSVCLYQGAFGVNDPRYLVQSDPFIYVFRIAFLTYLVPLLEVLPLYVVFLVFAAPLVCAFKNGYAAAVFLASAALWLYSASFSCHPRMSEISYAFNPLSWQVLFVAGLYYGAVLHSRDNSDPRANPRLFAFDCVCAALTVYVILIRHEIVPLVLSQEAADRAVSPRRLLPWGLILNDLLFCRALRLLGMLNYERWPGMRWFAYVGRESLLVFSVSIATFYILMGTNVDFGVYSPAGQSIVFLILIGSTIFPVFLKRSFNSRA